MNKKFQLNAFQLKVIAILAMTIDHIACVFIKYNQSPVAYNIMRATGRIAFPIIAYMIAEGYHKTRDVKKYMARLYCFAVVSMLPYYLVFGNPFNVGFTLLVGLMVLYICDLINSYIIKTIILFLGMLVTARFDWGIYGVLMIFLFSVIKDQNKKIVTSLSICTLLYFALEIISFLQHTDDGLDSLLYLFLCIWLAAPLLLSYNGQLGKSKKHIFYIFYPVHLLIIALIKMLIK